MIQQFETKDKQIVKVYTDENFGYQVWKIEIYELANVIKPLKNTEIRKVVIALGFMSLLYRPLMTLQSWVDYGVEAVIANNKEIAEMIYYSRLWPEPSCLMTPGEARNPRVCASERGAIASTAGCRVPLRTWKQAFRGWTPSGAAT